MFDVKRKPLLTLLLLVTLAFTPMARAQGNAPLISSSVNDLGARAWTIYRNSQRDNVLVFIAPRDAIPDARPPIDAAPPGQVQSMRTLSTRAPLALASMQSRVFLVYPAVYAGSNRLMRVYSARALPGSVGGLWVIDPPSRLDTQPAIITDGDLIDLQATHDTLYALLSEDNTPKLRYLLDDAWEDIPLPEGLNTRNLDLVALGNQLALVDRAGAAFSAQTYDSVTQQWTTLPDTLPIGMHTQLLSSEQAIIALDWDEDGNSRLRSWSPSGLFELIRGSSLPSDAHYAMLDSSNTLMGVRHSEPDPETAEPQPSIELLEFDARTLESRYRGPPAASAPVTAEEFRFLVGMMVLIMLGVLVVVIMPDRTDAMQIPEACVLADPGRRLIATMLDAVLVASLVGWVFDVSASEILTLTVIVRPDSAWAVIPATIISGVLLGTFCEWLFGFTPGKVLMGLRVVRAQHDVVQRPRFWSALVRNIIKWVLPPVAALALVDPESLHRGDRASRSLVVMPRPAQPPADDRD